MLLWSCSRSLSACFSGMCSGAARPNQCWLRRHHLPHSKREQLPRKVGEKRRPLTPLLKRQHRQTSPVTIFLPKVIQVLGQATLRSLSSSSAITSDHTANAGVTRFSIHYLQLTREKFGSFIVIYP